MSNLSQNSRPSGQDNRRRRLHYVAGMPTATPGHSVLVSCYADDVTFEALRWASLGLHFSDNSVD